MEAAGANQIRKACRTFLTMAATSVSSWHSSNISPLSSTAPSTIHISTTRTSTSPRGRHNRFINSLRPPWTRDESHNNSHDAHAMPSTKSPHGNSSQFNQKLKNFFRINSLSHTNAGSEKPTHGNGSGGFGQYPHGDQRSDGSNGKGTFRGTRLFTSTVGRLRSHTVASEGHPLDDPISPTAHANPYFAHQGLPGLRHRNEGSAPPSPPDTPDIKVNGSDDHPTAATKEELARKLRRVASAPNAQGLFAKSKGSGDRPSTAELGKDPLLLSNGSTHLGLVDDSKSEADKDDAQHAHLETDSLGALPQTNLRAPATFRRTYSSNSIKIRSVEVGPQSFDKVKLIGKGDVGKVYLVREKKSTRLYAMKGTVLPDPSRLDGRHGNLSPSYHV